MICDSCGRPDPTYHYTVFRDNKVVEVHICVDCRKKNRQLRPDEHEEENEEILLDSLIHTRNKDTDGLYDRRCDVCGTSYREVVSDNLLGCANCYRVFQDTFEEEASHERSSHIHHLKVLKRELNEAVRMELFEKAAEIRDKIKALDAGGYLE